MFGLLCGQTVFGQENIIVTGKVVGKDNNPLSAASVYLKNTTTLDSLKLITNIDGMFEVELKKKNQYQITISYVGYNILIKILSENDYNNENQEINFKLIRSEGMMENITLEAQKIQIKEDTISYKVDSTMYRKNDNVETMLKNLPGIQVEKDGTVMAQGKQVTKVKVNGKDFFGGDVTVATRELNADMVERIQIIDDYGDQAAFTGIKDGDPTKTINIELKKSKNKGIFGNITGGLGTNDRYLGSANTNFFNNDQQLSLLGNINNINASLFNSGNGGGGNFAGGNMGGGRGNMGNRSGGSSGGLSTDGVSALKSVGTNYKDDWGKKLSFYGSYNYVDKSTTTLKNTNQQTAFQGRSSEYLQFSNSLNQSINHRLSSNLEYKIDSFNQLKINFNYSSNNTNYKSGSDFNSKIGEVNLSTGANNSIGTSNGENLSGSILYNKRFNKKGRTLSLNLSASKNQTESNDSIDNQTIVFRNPLDSIAIIQKQKLNQNNESKNKNIRISYSEPIDNKRILEFNYTYSEQEIYNKRETFVPDTTAGNQLTFLDSALSNVYNNLYTFHRMGLNLKTTLKKYNYTIGFSAQPAEIVTTSTGVAFQNKLINFFPVVRFAYNFSKSRSLNINYNGSTNQPSSTQLLPVVDRSNPQFIVIGNPDLKPEFNNILSLRYNNFDMISGNVFFGNLSFTYTQDKIVNNTKLLRAGAQETSYLNANGSWSANAFYNVSRPIKNRKYVFNLGGNLSYGKEVSFLRDSLNNLQNNIGNNWVITQRFNTDIKIKKWLETTIGGRFTQNVSRYSIQNNLNFNSTTWILSNNSRIFLPKDFIISYDIEQTFNLGFSSNTVKNPLIIQASIEKQFLKAKNLTAKIQSLDLLNQNIGISRTLSSNGFTDTRTNRLGRYFMFSLIYRLNKFVGDMKASDNMMKSGFDTKSYRIPGF